MNGIPNMECRFFVVETIMAGAKEIILLDFILYISYNKIKRKKGR